MKLLGRFVYGFSCTECGRWVSRKTVIVTSAVEDPRRPVAWGTCSQDGRILVERRGWWTRR